MPIDERARLGEDGGLIGRQAGRKPAQLGEVARAGKRALALGRLKAGDVDGEMRRLTVEAEEYAGRAVLDERPDGRRRLPRDGQIVVARDGRIELPKGHEPRIRRGQASRQPVRIAPLIGRAIERIAGKHVEARMIAQSSPLFVGRNASPSLTWKLRARNSGRNALARARPMG